MRAEDEIQDTRRVGQITSRARLVALVVGIVVVCSTILVLSSQYSSGDACPLPSACPDPVISAEFAAFFRQSRFLETLKEITSPKVGEIEVGRACALNCANGASTAHDCSSCICTSGWTGERCDVPLACDGAELSHCQNGGWREITSPGDCHCLCPPGYAGMYCTERLEVDPEEEINFLTALLDHAEEESKRRAALDSPILPSGVGYGRHPYSGKIALPIVPMEAGSAVFDLKGQIYTVPSGMTVDASVASQTPKPVTTAWQTIRQYIDSVINWNQIGAVIPSSLSEVHDSYDDLLINFFAAGSSLGQVRYSVPLYKVTASNPDALTNRPLSPSIQQAFNYLASFSFPERQDLFFTLLGRIGTCVVWESVNGGSIERTSKMKPDVWKIGGGVNVQYVKEQLEINWHGGNGAGQWTKSDPLFKKEVDWVRQTCLGGNSVEGDCMAVEVASWTTQLHRMPLPILDQVISVSNFVKDAQLKKNIDLALPAFLAAQKARFHK